jgi:hypothetical protein
VLSKHNTMVLHSKLPANSLDTRLLIDDAYTSLPGAERRVLRIALPVLELCDGFLSLQARWARNPLPKPRKPPLYHLGVLYLLGASIPGRTRRDTATTGGSAEAQSPAMPPSCPQVKGQTSGPRKQGPRTVCRSAPAGNHDFGTCVLSPESCRKNRPGDSPAVENRPGDRNVAGPLAGRSRNSPR